MKSVKYYIPCIEQKKLLKSIWQYNEFNKGIIPNGYYIYEFRKLIILNNLQQMYLKLLQKKVIHKIAEATGDLMGNKIGKKKYKSLKKFTTE